MKMKMYISCILALMMTAAVWAVDRPEGPESPQKQATATLNGTEADQFMSLTEWSTVKFNKLFTYAGFAQKSVSGRYELDLGVAFKAGPVYIGTWYQGNLGQLTAKDNKAVTTKITESTIVPGTIDEKTTTTNPHVYNSHEADHTAAVLVGFGNMGVRLGYVRDNVNKSGSYFNGSAQSGSDVKRDKYPQLIDETVYDSKGYINKAHRLTTVDFGMDISLGKFSLTPNIGLGVNVQQNSQYGAMTSKRGNNLTQKLIVRKEVQGSNNTATNLQVKLGTDFGLNDSLNSTFSFGYDFGIDIYGKKKHTAADGSVKELQNGYKIQKDDHEDNVTGTKHVIKNNFNVTTHNKSFVANTITLGYAMRKDFTERFSFFAGVEAPIGFDFRKNTATTSMTEVYLERDDADSSFGRTKIKRTTLPAETVKTTTFTLDPTFKASLTYAAIPERLFVSFGADVKPFGSGKYKYEGVTTTVNAFATTEETTTSFNDKRPVKKEIKQEPVLGGKEESYNKTVTYGKADATVKFGVRWNIIDAVSFDVVYNRSVLETIKWTEIGNLKLACTIKF